MKYACFFLPRILWKQKFDNNNEDSHVYVHSSISLMLQSNDQKKNGTLEF